MQSPAHLAVLDLRARAERLLADGERLRLGRRGDGDLLQHRFCRRTVLRILIILIVLRHRSSRDGPVQARRVQLWPLCARSRSWVDRRRPGSRDQGCRLQGAAGDYRQARQSERGTRETDDVSVEPQRVECGCGG